MDYPKSDPTVGLVDGKFTDGDPAGAVAASRDPASWANAVTDEILAVLVEAGVTPTEGSNSQLAAALVELGLRATSADLPGIIELATNNEVQAGTDTVRAVTPAGLASFAKLLEANGYLKLPGGLILQWGGTGNITAGATQAVTYPIAFPVGMQGCSVSPSYAIAGAGAAYMSHVNTSASTLTINNTGAITCAARWLAIGY